MKAALAGAAALAFWSAVTAVVVVAAVVHQLPARPDVGRKLGGFP